MADRLPATEQEIFEAAEKQVRELLRGGVGNYIYDGQPDPDAPVHATVEAVDGTWTIDVRIILRPPSDEQS